jgi:hypothetical protein
MLEALTAAQQAMRETIQEFTHSGFKDRSELEEVLHLNEDLAIYAQEMLDPTLVEACVHDDIIAKVRGLATYFEATERLLITMLETAEVG